MIHIRVRFHVDYMLISLSTFDSYKHITLHLTSITLRFSSFEPALIAAWKKMRNGMSRISHTLPSEKENMIQVVKGKEKVLLMKMGPIHNIQPNV